MSATLMLPSVPDTGMSSRHRPDGLAISELGAQARKFLQESKSPATRRAHREDWRRFETWCEQAGVQALPASRETIIEYLSVHGLSHKPATLERWLASISKAHQAAGFVPSPTRAPGIRQCLAGVRRVRVNNDLPVRPNKKRPLRASELRAIVDAIPDTIRGQRDRALLLLGYAGGFRRSELVALEVRDIEFRDGGVLVTLRKSKTNQEGREVQVKDVGPAPHVNVCPVRALRAWIDVAGLVEGPVFRGVTRHSKVGDHSITGRTVAFVVKRHVAKLGLDPAEFGAHSLRSGLITDFLSHNGSSAVGMRLTGHRCEAVFNGYFQPEPFEINVTAVVFG